MNFNRYSKTISDFSDYTVSSDGRVFNKNKHELKQTINRGGYSMVKLCRNGYEKTCSVHRLVAEAYIPNPENKKTVNHIDGNKLNNDVSNLEWATCGENLKHAYAKGLKKSYLTNDDRVKGVSTSKEKSRKSVFVKETGMIYESVRDCAKQTGFDAGAISKCCNGLAKQHHNHHFSFVD